MALIREDKVTVKALKDILVNTLNKDLKQFSMNNPKVKYIIIHNHSIEAEVVINVKQAIV